MSVLSSDDGSIATLVKSGHGLGHLQSACGLAIDVDTGNLIVADTGNDRVRVGRPEMTEHFNENKTGFQTLYDNKLRTDWKIAISTTLVC